MLRTSTELTQDLPDQIKARCLALGLTQQEAAQRSGVAYRTWRRGLHSDLRRRSVWPTRTSGGTFDVAWGKPRRDA